MTSHFLKKNDSNKLVSKKNNSNSKIVKYNINNSSIKLTNRLRKSKKLSKFQKIFKSKKLLKSRNLPKINIKKTVSSFLLFDTKTALNYLQLAFIKALIF